MNPRSEIGCAWAIEVHNSSTLATTVRARSGFQQDFGRTALIV
jgi:hypothetical protein